MTKVEQEELLENVYDIYQKTNALNVRGRALKMIKQTLLALVALVKLQGKYTTIEIDKSLSINDIAIKMENECINDYSL